LTRNYYFFSCVSKIPIKNRENFENPATLCPFSCIFAHQKTLLNKFGCFPPSNGIANVRRESAFFSIMQKYILIEEFVKKADGHKHVVKEAIVAIYKEQA